MRVLHEVVPGQELDARDAEVCEVLDGAVVREAGVGAADLLGHRLELLREALHVDLVDDCLVVRGARGLVVLPVEAAVGHDGAGHRGGGVGVVDGVRVVEGVREDVLAPGGVALDRDGVGVEQELGGVVAEAAGGVPLAVDAEAVAGADAGALDEAVEHVAGALGEAGAGLGAVVVEDAHLHRLGGLGVHGDVQAAGQPSVAGDDGRAERVGAADVGTADGRLVDGHRFSMLAPAQLLRARRAIPRRRSGVRRSADTGPRPGAMATARAARSAPARRRRPTRRGARRAPRRDARRRRAAHPRP